MEAFTSQLAEKIIELNKPHEIYIVHEFGKCDRYIATFDSLENLLLYMNKIYVNSNRQKITVDDIKHGRLQIIDQRDYYVYIITKDTINKF